MYYRIAVSGVSPLIMHDGAKGLDTRSPEHIEKTEISKKRGTNRTVVDESRLRELETYLSLWTNTDGTPTIPTAAFRGTIEAGARKFKQGPQVREGLLVTEVNEFQYDKKLGKTAKELAKSTQFTTPVVVGAARILRTRAQFDTWGAVFTVEVDEELVDKAQLLKWLDVAGRRIGIGDWRPATSGDRGRFEVNSIKEVDG